MEKEKMAKTIKELAAKCREQAAVIDDDFGTAQLNSLADWLESCLSASETDDAVRAAEMWNAATKEAIEKSIALRKENHDMIAELWEKSAEFTVLMERFEMIKMEDAGITPKKS